MVWESIKLLPLYAIGDTARLFYDSKNLTTGLSLVIARVRKPDGSKFTTPSLPELDGGVDSLTSGVYVLDLNIDQDGVWYIRFDCANVGFSRPQSYSLYVETALKQALLTTVQDIDQELSTNHGTGSWETPQLPTSPTIGTPFDFGGN